MRKEDRIRQQQSQNPSGTLPEKSQPRPSEQIKGIKGSVPHEEPNRPPRSPASSRCLTSRPSDSRKRIHRHATRPPYQLSDDSAPSPEYRFNTYINTPARPRTVATADDDAPPRSGSAVGLSTRRRMYTCAGMARSPSGRLRPRRGLWGRVLRLEDRSPWRQGARA
jgi:hypothetical protein